MTNKEISSVMVQTGFRDKVKVVGRPPPPHTCTLGTNYLNKRKCHPDSYCDGSTCL